MPGGKARKKTHRIAVEEALSRVEALEKVRLQKQSRNHPVKTERKRYRKRIRRATAV